MTIELWTCDTPNGRKISVALEEIGLPYAVKVVDITKGEQFNPEFLAFSPNNRIPAIRDPAGPDGQPITAFESGAILIYRLLRGICGCFGAYRDGCDAVVRRDGAAGG
jgi:GST-like protein